jgi:hypothetical protein
MTDVQPSRDQKRPHHRDTQGTENTLLIKIRRAMIVFRACKRAVRFALSLLV